MWFDSFRFSQGQGGVERIGKQSRTREAGLKARQISSMCAWLPRKKSQFCTGLLHPHLHVPDHSFDSNMYWHHKSNKNDPQNAPDSFDSNKYVLARQMQVTQTTVDTVSV